MHRRLFTVALLTTVLVMSVLVAPSEAAAPGRKKWLKDTRSAMQGSRTFIAKRVQQGGTKLAVNLDIDNTSLASHYRPGSAVPAVRRFARYANSRGVAVVFNTGRRADALARPAAMLRAAGFPVAAICGRREGEGLVAGKQRCRRQYVEAGFTIIANVGNRSTDLVGGDYQRGFKLPDYGNRLS